MAYLRIDKALSDMGIATRSETKLMIKQGRVVADGKKVFSASEKINADTAEIIVDGKSVLYKKFRYIMMNKPGGYVSATEDGAEKTILELLTPELKKSGLFPVGRLDKDTEGLIILTNDGEFCHNVISPKKHVIKKYYAEVDGVLSAENVTAFSRGIALSDGTVCRPGKLKIIEKGNTSKCFVSICEGKYHQVKRMLASIGKPVIYLKRISIGNLILDERLKPGMFREINDDELQSVFKNSL